MFHLTSNTLSFGFLGKPFLLFYNFLFILGRSLTRALGSPLLIQNHAAKVGALVPKQSLAMSPAMMGRIYGPGKTYTFIILLQLKTELLSNLYILMIKLLIH